MEYEEAYRVRMEKDVALRKALKQNPYLEHGLGDLVREMHVLYAKDPNVIKPETEVPPESKQNYQTYSLLVKMINNRERKYTAESLSDMRF